MYAFAVFIKRTRSNAVPIQDFESLPSECQLLDPDKERETDPRLRLILIETLILLCATLEGRKCLKENGVYRIVQIMHLTEPDEAVGFILYSAYDIGLTFRRTGWRCHPPSRSHFYGR